MLFRSSAPLSIGGLTATRGASRGAAEAEEENAAPSKRAAKATIRVVIIAKAGARIFTPLPLAHIVGTPTADIP